MGNVSANLYSFTTDGDGAGDISDELLETVASSAMHCQRIDYGGEFPDSGLSLIAHGCPSLTLLQLDGCNNSSSDERDFLSDEGVSALAADCRQLQYLSVSGCENTVTDAGLTALAFGCNGLQATAYYRMQD